MNAGDLRHRVTIQTLTEVSDGHDGFSDPTWASVARLRRLPARVRPLAGRDLERARQVDPRISHDVTLRYWQAYTTDLDGGRARLVYHDLADRTFEIVGPPVDAEEKHVELTMLCKEAA
jgi:head-tail adaptor